MSAMKIDRRSFVTGAVGAVGMTAAVTLVGGAVADADEVSADAEIDWLGEAPHISDDDCVETIDAAILVVGAGMSGYFAACAAAEEGADVILIEKASTGVGVRCSAIGAINSKLQLERGIQIDPMDITNDFTHYGSNHNDASLIKIWADNSGEAVDWYIDVVEAAGLFVELEWNMPPEETRYSMWPVGHGTVAQLNTPGHLGGAAEVEGKIQQALLSYFEEHGGRSMFDTQMERLVQDENGRVVGIYATNEDGEQIRINASVGVVLATGGYAYNEAMMSALQPEFKKSLAGLFAFPGATGDGIKAALWAGASMSTNPANVLFGRGAIPPTQKIGDPYHDSVSQYFSFAEQPFLKVGVDGERLCNESAPYLYVMNAAAQRNANDRAWYIIWDSNWPEDVERFHTIACSTLLMRDGGNHDPDEFMSIENVQGYIDSLLEDGYIMQADSLEELAGKLLIADVDTFLKTAERYNELFDMQKDEDFGKEPFRLSALRQAPFFGVRLGGEELCTLHGVRVDADCRALRADNTPIEGLYMIGNDQGGFFADLYPNFAAGANAGRCATFGRLVGKQLAR